MKKLFILDTCVMLNDPDSLFKMGDHDIGLCTEVINELDRIKDSSSFASYEARQVIRTIYHYLGGVSAAKAMEGVPLGEGLGALKLIHHKSNLSGDEAIIECVLAVQSSNPDGDVVLVTRDMNMNLRAKISGVKSVEDYRSDRVVKTEALDDDGFLSIDFDIWERFSDMKTNGIDYTCAVKGDDLQEVLVPNRFIKKGDEVYRIVSFLEGILSLKLVVKKDVFGIFPKNERQLAGIDVLMDQDIGLVSLTGSAGCGKTLLAMAAALEQVLVQKVFDRIVVVRNTPPIAEDTGFFPGNEEEKMLPFLQGVVDALGVLGAEKDNKGTFEYLVDAANIEFRSINTMRGASLNKTFFIVEEGQNTTANAMKAMITRVGQTSKVVMTGNLNSSQIDASYATPWSNGLIRAIEVFTGHGRAAHVQLQGGQRGDIASHAEEFL